MELHASKREMVYNRIVVDKIIRLAESCDASMPLNLRLEACFEVGTASVKYMLRVARSLEETVITNISQACRIPLLSSYFLQIAFYKQPN